MRRARPDEAARVEALWTAPANAMWIEPPEPGEIAAGIDAGEVFVWDAYGEVVGFASIVTWVPEVYGLSALATSRPGTGTPLLRALLAEVFGPLGGHRIGFDVTVDNHRALRLYDRLGFRREGLIRECWRRPDGNWVDCYLLGLLARDWQP